MFSIKEYILRKIAGTNKEVVDVKALEGLEEAFNDALLSTLAFWSCVNKITNAFLKCEFRTYKANEEFKGEEYYRWNISPNQNQSAAQFMTKLLAQLYSRNEALVVEVGKNLYVAESYSLEKFALKDYVFTGVTFDGYTLSDTFLMEDVLYFKLNNCDVRRLVNRIGDNWRKVLNYATTAYRTNSGTHGIMRIDGSGQFGDDFSKELDDLMQNRVKPFFEGQNTVLPLYEGWQYEQLDKKNYSESSTRDIKNLADDVYDFTARAFAVPPALLRGEVQDTEKAIDELITFCIDPLAVTIEDELNRKLYAKGRYLNGNYVKISTRNIKHKDIFELATPIEKLIGSGAFSVNDILRELGEPLSNEEWADAHFMTKNFSTIQDFLEGLAIETTGKGGNEDAQRPIELVDAADSE